MDASSRWVDGSLASNLGLSRSAVTGTVTRAAVDDPDGRGLRDGRITLDDATVVWRNPSTRDPDPPGQLVGDYLATSEDKDAWRICAGDRVLVLLTEPAEPSARPPVHLAQVVYPLVDDRLTNHRGGPPPPSPVSGVPEDELGASLRRASEDIPPALLEVVDLPMDERLAELEAREPGSTTNPPASSQ